MMKVRPWRVSMNAEKISRPFAALPLHDWSAHGPPCISTFKQRKFHPPTFGCDTTGRNLQSYNQKFGDSAHLDRNQIRMNTKHIEAILRKSALEVKNGDYTQEQLGQKLSAVAAEIEQLRKANERPITAETLAQIRVGPPARTR